MESLPVPESIQEDILIRLPLKSLLACIYVCKKWNTMICDEGFKTRFLRRTLLILSTTRAMDSLPDSLFHSICRRERRYTVSAPIRGWICVKSSTKLRLYNPIANEILHLPVSPGRGELYPRECLFGYDEANGVFKVLGFFSSGFEVYTVRPGGEESWRTIAFEQHPDHSYDSPRVDSFPPLSVTNALCKGGVLYYIATSLNQDLTPTIMSFDLNLERFAVIPPPGGFIVDDRSTLMVNYNEKIALVNNSATELQSTGGFQIFVREEDSGQWVSERIEILGWKESVWSGSLLSFVGTVGTIGSAGGELVFTTEASMFAETEYVLYYKPDKGFTGIFMLGGANKGAYHYVRACLNHFECLLRA